MSVEVTTTAGNSVTATTSGGTTVSFTTTSSSVSVTSPASSSISILAKGPKGDTGATGATGATGSAATVSAGDGIDVSSGEVSTDLKSNGGLVIESTELAVDLAASSITGTLAIGDGGTGSTSTTYCALGSNVSGTLPVANGGTGATSLTTDGVLFGNGTSAISAVDLSSNGNIIVGGSTPAAVAGATLAGSGLAATTGNGTLVLDVETLNQNTTGTAAGLSATLAVGSGGTGLTTVATNTILTGNSTSALTSEANLTFSSNRLTIGDNGEDIQPFLRIMNDENSLELGISNAADDFVTGSADGDIVFNSFGDHNILFGQNDVLAAKIDTDGNFNLNRKFTVTGDTDGTYEGDVVYFGGTTSMTTGALYHYKSDGTWELARANAVATCDGLLAIALGAASDTNGMLLRGMVTVDHDTGAVGDVLFVSDSAGDITATAPSDNNDIVRVIGYCLHASNGQIWFNPDGAFVEVTA